MDQELKEYLNSQFAETNRRLDETNQQVAENARRLNENTRRLDEMNRRLDETNQQVGENGRQLGENNRLLDETNQQVADLRDDVHQTRILVEKLDDKIDLVAEGVKNNTEVMHRLIEENQHELKEHKVVIESAHRHLEQRVSKHDTEIRELNRRVDVLGRMTPR